jgi:NurA-like 5'-3' nuclease
MLTDAVYNNISHLFMADIILYMGEIIINEEELRQSMLKLRNDELLVGLTGLYDYFENKYNKEYSRAKKSIKEIEKEFSLKVLDDLFEGRNVFNPKVASKMAEQHLIGKIIINGEPKSLYLQYFVDKNNVPYFGSLKLNEDDTIYA